MKVHLIVEREDGDNDAHWIIDAVDEWTIDEWNGAYPGPFQAKLDEDPVNRRILMVDIPDDAMQRPWWQHTVKGNVAE